MNNCSSVIYKCSNICYVKNDFHDNSDKQVPAPPVRTSWNNNTRLHTACAADCFYGRRKEKKKLWYGFLTVFCCWAPRALVFYNWTIRSHVPTLSPRSFDATIKLYSVRAQDGEFKNSRYYFLYIEGILQFCCIIIYIFFFNLTLQLSPSVLKL